MRRIRALSLIAALALIGAACGGDDKAADTGSSTPVATNAVPASATGPGTGGKAVGFIFVGPKDDFGYNQAAYQGLPETSPGYEQTNAPVALFRE